MKKGFEIGTRVATASREEVANIASASFDKDLLKFVKTEKIELIGRPGANPEQVLREITQEYLQHATDQGTQPSDRKRL